MYDRYADLNPTNCITKRGKDYERKMTNSNLIYRYVKKVKDDYMSFPGLTVKYIVDYLYYLRKYIKKTESH